MIIDHRDWNLSSVQSALQSKLELDAESRKKIQSCRDYLDNKMSASDQAFYGINTGFGSLCNVRVSNQDLETLQRNLILSHACGMGAEINPRLVKLMLLLKIKNFTYGHSGVSVALVERLIDFYNADILPIVYSQGSLGASGDLAPLAHISLALIGEGDVIYSGQRKSSAEVHQALGWEPIKLQSKEGLALINGTQFMNALAIDALLRSQKAIQYANKIACISMDAFDASLQPFYEGIHGLRKHHHQIHIAQDITKLMEDSVMIRQPKQAVQDPYSFRCIPQVHGATLDAIRYAENIFVQEANAVTDNPLIFPEQDVIVSGGNFHGQILALPIDFLKIAIAELANISERRTYLLISGQRGLPPFLANHAGLESGLMIAQYTAAAIVSANKQLCTPASVDSIVSSNGQEDHVSMGANAAVQLQQVIDNVESVLGIELMTATIAMRFRDAEKTSSANKKLIALAESLIQKGNTDALTRNDMTACKRIITEDLLK